jgi:hypothetical protein
LDVDGSITSLGYNLIGTTNNQFSAGWVASDLTGNDITPLNPLLGVLQNNGGTTLTHALFAGSPAIDAGTNFGVTTDQIGQPRPVIDSGIVNGGDGSDIGAFEAVPSFTLTVAITGSGTVTTNPVQASYTAGTAVALTATAAEGWLFNNWSGDAGGSANPLSVTMTNNKSITANFVLSGPPPTNSIWTNVTDGRWEVAGNWLQAGVPAVSMMGVFITNAGSKTITLDGVTVSNAPGSLTVSNLTIAASGGSTNTLALVNAGTNTPLHLLASLALGPGGAISLDGSTLQVEDDDRNNANQDIPNVVLDGVLSGNNSALVFTNGTYADPGDLAGIGAFQPGTVNLTNGSLGVYTLDVGGQSQGTLNLVNCTTTNINGFYAGHYPGSTGTVTLAGGSFGQYGGEFMIGCSGSGQMTVSNATVNIPSIFLGFAPGASGTLTMQSGSLTTRGIGVGNVAGLFQMNGGQAVMSALGVGNAAGGTGALNFTGGSLLITNAAGFEPAGVNVAVFPESTGLLNISGGELSDITSLSVGAPTATGTVMVSSNGLLLVANPSGYGGYQAYIDLRVGASLAVNGGTLNVDSLYLNNGLGTNVAGTYSQSNGIAIVNANMIVGDCVGGVSATATLNGGTLYVTNAAHTAVLDVRDGTFTLNAGATLVVDTLIVTNSCGQFVKLGGSLTYGQLFGQITTPPQPNLLAVSSGSTVVVSWPSSLTGWTLQQNSDLTTTNWTASGYSITSANGTNSITITSPTGNLFFRLANQ